MGDVAEYVDGLPNISGSEERIEEAIRASRAEPAFLPEGASGFGEIDSAACSISMSANSKVSNSSPMSS
jgi:hypothetical protein